MRKLISMALSIGLFLLIIQWVLVAAPAIGAQAAHFLLALFPPTPDLTGSKPGPPWPPVQPAPAPVEPVAPVETPTPQPSPEPTVDPLPEPTVDPVVPEPVPTETTSP